MNDLTQVDMPAKKSIMEKPGQDAMFAHNAAKRLMELVNQNGWMKKIGQSDHLQFEAWQTAGRFYGYTVKTNDPKPQFVEYGTAKGFEAQAQVIDTRTGEIVGGASALCLNDEPNWRNKPLFQLASMAQTRAGSKALRQILSFVVALAGYNPTPAEEMDAVKEGQIDSWGKTALEAKEVFDVNPNCTCGTKNKFHKKDCPEHQEA